MPDMAGPRGRFDVIRDDELFRRAVRGGDEEAFAALYRARQGGLYRFALHMTGSPAAAEDITQEVFLALIRQPRNYDPSRGPLLGYLYGIARHLIARHLGRSSPAGLTRLDGEHAGGLPRDLASDEDPLRDLTRKETIERVRLGIAALPPRFREVVALCELQEMDYAEAAAVLGCPIGTVRSRLHRARRLLVRTLVEPSSTSAVVEPLEPVRCLP
jgi:RNA polymerase sigma-70 factor (ECF subfamily)